VLRARVSLSPSKTSPRIPVLDGVRADVSSVTILGADAASPSCGRTKRSVFSFCAPPHAVAPCSEREIGFCRIVANATGVALRNARVMQSSARSHTASHIRPLRGGKTPLPLPQALRRLLRVGGRRPRRHRRRGAPCSSSIRGHSRSSAMSEQELLGKKMRSLLSRATDSASVRARNLRRLRARTVSAGASTFTCAARTASRSHLRFFVLGPRRRRRRGAPFVPRRDGGASDFRAELVEDQRSSLESLIDASVDPIVASDMEGHDHPLQQGRRARVRLEPRRSRSARCTCACSIRETARAKS
jgi:hypothetical protein